MPTMNAFQILAKKKLASLATEKIMMDDNFAKRLAVLLYESGCSKGELVELLRDIKQNDEHNHIENKTKDYVYNRFNIFDQNLNWLDRKLMTV